MSHGFISKDQFNSKCHFFLGFRYSLSGCLRGHIGMCVPVHAQVQDIHRAMGCRQLLPLVGFQLLQVGLRFWCT